MNPHTQVLLVVTITAIAFLGYIAATLLGIPVIAPLLLYFPIILAAYWFPKKGVLFAVAVGILEVFFVYFSRMPSVPDITFAVTTASFYVLVAIAVVISSLSGGLKEREARYRGLFNSSEAGIFLVRCDNSDLIIEEVNIRGGTLLGCHPGDLVGESFLKYWDDRPFLNSLVHSGSNPISVTQRESRITLPDGSGIPVLISGSNLPGKMMVLTVIDISSRKVQEEEIQTRNQQLSIINRVITEASGAQGLDDMFGRVLSNMMGYLDCGYGGVSLFEEGSYRIATQYHQGDEHLFRHIQKASDGSCAELIRSIEAGRSLVWKSDAGGETEGPCAGIVVPLESGKEKLGTMYFLSGDARGCSASQHQTIEFLAREVGAAVSRLVLTQRIHEANHQANLYLDILMHDINNANLASLWYGDLLMDMLTGEPKETARKMMDGVQKSRAVIRNLETIRKIQVRKNDLRIVSLDMAIQKEIRFFPDAHIEYRENGIEVMADELLGEIFTNLIGNSIKFGGPAVRIAIEANMVPPDIVEVIFSDTGPGIPDDLKRVIFRRFSQTTPQSEGKGLGLYIVKTLLERYGGTITVSDRVEGDYTQGTIFRMTLKKASR